MKTHECQNECDRERIYNFLTGSSDRPDAVLTEQLEECATCRAFFDSQIASDDEWSQFGQMLRPGEHDHATRINFSAGSNAGQQARQSVSINDVLESLSPTDDPHSLGRIGKYEVTGVIGAGGMGVVLKGFEPSLDRVVAIKVLSPHLANNDKARQRFEREARAAAAVINPNVIPIYSVTNDGTLPYLVMACIQGGSLQQRLDTQGAASVAEVLRIGSQIASGLAAAHEQGLVHRDIKPENILFEGDVERVAITDFGLARAVDDNTVTQAGTIAGTPMYMSPEQARGEQVDQQSDLFSLGSVLYALCTGQPPYHADSSLGVMRKITDDSPTPIREINPDTPEWLSGIVEKLMAREKADRFASAAEVRDLLESCLSHVQSPESVPLPAQVQTGEGGGLLRTKSSTAVGFSGLIGLLAAVVFFVVTNKGTVKVEVLDESFQVAIDGEKLIVAEEGSSQPIELRPGAHKLTVKVGGTDFVTSDFEIRRNGEVAFRVELLNGKVEVSRDGKQIASKLMPSMIEEPPRARPGLVIADAWGPALAPGVKQILPSTQERVEVALLIRAGNSSVKAGDLKKATDAYLAAYRLAPCSLIGPLKIGDGVPRELVQIFQKADRFQELAECIDETALKRGLYNEVIARDTIKALLQDSKTKPLGHRLLKNHFRIYASRRANIASRPENYGVDWSQVPDLVFYLRTFLVPEDFEREGAGWPRFAYENPIVSAKSLFVDQDVLRQFAEEVRALTAKQKEWKGGLILLAVLEAEIGNLTVAERIITENFVGPEGLILPHRNAGILGRCIEGKSETLDGLAIRLAEYSLRHFVENKNAVEPKSYYTGRLRESSLPRLAKLYAKYGRKEEARKLLYGLVEVADQHPLVHGNRPSLNNNCALYNTQQCSACHRTEMNLRDYMSLAKEMTDLGYPVDSYVSLARIDASFGNFYSSSKGWAGLESNEPMFDRLAEFRESPGYAFAFNKQRVRASQMITPKAVMEALRLGTLQESPRYPQQAYEEIRSIPFGGGSELRYLASTYELEKTTSDVIDLMLSVRGEGPDAKATVFSPVIEVLKLAADFNGDGAEEDKDRLDDLLRLTSEVNPNDVQAAVSVTAFAFLRNDLATAKSRSEALQEMELSRAVDAQEANASLWLIARYAMEQNSTRSVGKALAEKALTAAKSLSAPDIKNAILREQIEVLVGQ